MNARPALLLVLAVVALGVGAANLDAGHLPSDDAGPPVERNRGAAPAAPPSAPAPPPASLGLRCPAPLGSPLGLVPVVSVAGLLAGTAYWRYRTPAAAAAVGLPALVVPVAVCPAVVPFGVPSVGPLPSAGAVIAGLLAVAGVAVAVVALAALAGEDVALDEAAAAAVDEDDDDPSLEAVGEAAGAAADRIEARAAVENEVFRAWREMTDHLDVSNRETATPREFAGVAAAAGMAREDVETLTRLFREVRYGGRDPADREARAVDALRRIEAAYAGEGSS